MPRKQGSTPDRQGVDSRESSVGSSEPLARETRESCEGSPELPLGWAQGRGRGGGLMSDGPTFRNDGLAGLEHNFLTGVLEDVVEGAVGEVDGLWDGFADCGPDVAALSQLVEVHAASAGGKMSAC